MYYLGCITPCHWHFNRFSLGHRFVTFTGKNKLLWCLTEGEATAPIQPRLPSLATLIPQPRRVASLLPHLFIGSTKRQWVILDRSGSGHTTRFTAVLLNFLRVWRSKFAAISTRARH